MHHIDSILANFYKTQEEYAKCLNVEDGYEYETLDVTITGRSKYRIVDGVPILIDRSMVSDEDILSAKRKLKIKGER